jgi:hypothetical protein
MQAFGNLGAEYCGAARQALSQHLALGWGDAQ